MSARPRADAIRAVVRARYAEIATGGGCCAPSTGGASSCCSGTVSGCGTEGRDSPAHGGLREARGEIPPGADLGLGCGSPTTLLTLTRGETVLDLGSGAGIDCFLAAQRVGSRGRAIGVDMTPEMLARARENARRGGYRNVEFRLGEIEHLPVADRSVDVVLSNCVINLAPDKDAVYREAYRVLRPGGRLAVADILAVRPIPARERADRTRWTSCTAGALEPDKVRQLLRKAGFRNVRIELARPPGGSGRRTTAARTAVVSASIRATKPAA